MATMREPGVANRLAEHAAGLVSIGRSGPCPSGEPSILDPMPRSLPDDLLKVPHRRDVPFARLTTLGVGGLCRWLFEPTTESEAQAFVRGCARESSFEQTEVPVHFGKTGETVPDPFFGGEGPERTG